MADMAIEQPELQPGQPHKYIPPRYTLETPLAGCNSPTELETSPSQNVVLVATEHTSKSPGFPSAWLKPIPDTLVIDGADWNNEPAPETDPPPLTEFSVEWDKFYGTNYLTRWIWDVEIAGLIIHRYFNVSECIIPVAFIARHPLETFVFTTAGPCDDDGGKKFYIFNYDSPLSETRLHVFRRTFSSVADFHRNRRRDQLERVPEQADREEETEAALVACGFQRALKLTRDD
ncbi:hypothetical protein MSAN_00431600 [Mycena sanguinolenta]|uniref:Uncharacterized protein n=1 Tax=Mycena sanguinolenta TaxID=230812 RepID=A0A8H6ZD32_9AGAR|nr:hypothetical protein MSAN_00431600 [Mycena sanguinolenta]